MSTRNDTITTSSNGKDVEKTYWKHYWHWVGHDYFFLNNVPGGGGAPKRLKLENVGYNVEGHQEIHKGHF
jgi:hypothetical protein